MTHFKESLPFPISNGPWDLPNFSSSFLLTFLTMPKRALITDCREGTKQKASTKATLKGTEKSDPKPQGSRTSEQGINGRHPKEKKEKMIHQTPGSWKSKQLTNGIPRMRLGMKMNVKKARSHPDRPGLMGWCLSRDHRPGRKPGLPGREVGGRLASPSAPGNNSLGKGQVALTDPKWLPLEDLGWRFGKSWQPWCVAR